MISSQARGVTTPYNLVTSLTGLSVSSPAPHTLPPAKQLFTSSPLTANTSTRHGGGHETDYCQTLTVLQHRPDGERRSPLQVSVTSSSSAASRGVSIVLTDPGDYFCYFSVSLQEEDFNSLKAQQGLLVDFSQFGVMVTQLLDKCREETNSQQPKFILVLNQTQQPPCLEFTELNMFKHLIHLSLVLVRATDSQLKDYLVLRLSQLTKEKEEEAAGQQQQITDLQQKLSFTSEQLQEATVQLEQLRRELNTQATSLETRHSRSVETEKEKCRTQVKELQWKYESELNELQAKNLKLTQQLENRVASLDVQNRDLWEVRVGHEASLREARGQLACREEEVGRLRREVAGLRQEKQLVESQGSEADRELGQVRGRLGQVEQELAERVETIRQLHEVKERLGREGEERQKLVDKRETTIKKLSGEILKANEIIAKLQDGVRQEQGKTKLRGHIAQEQERLLSDRDKELGECREQLRESKVLIDTLNSRQEELERSDQEKNLKIEELEKVVKTNENVINWLNKQINPEKESGKQTAPGPAVASKRGGGRARQPLSRVQSGRNNATKEKVEEKQEAVVGGLDPAYFLQSTPGGTAYRHEIPAQLPANVSRGAGLVRREMR